MPTAILLFISALSFFWNASACQRGIHICREESAFASVPFLYICEFHLQLMSSTLNTTKDVQCRSLAHAQLKGEYVHSPVRHKTGPHIQSCRSITALWEGAQQSQAAFEWRPLWLSYRGCMYMHVQTHPCTRVPNS